MPLFSVFGFKARPVSMYVVSSRQSSITETMLERGAEEVLAPFAPRIWVVREENRKRNRQGTTMWFWLLSLSDQLSDQLLIFLGRQKKWFGLRDKKFATDK